MDNQREKSRRVRLGPGERSKFSFTFSRSEPDNYRVEVPGFGGKLVSVYVVEPLGPKEPLFRVGWYLKPPRGSDSENAPTRLLVTASASTGVKMELYKVQKGELISVENEWWAATEVDDKKLTTVIGRGTSKTQGFALIVKGASRKTLYRGYKEYEAGKAEVNAFSVYRAARRENCEYSIRKVNGEVRGDLPIFVASGEVYIDGKSVDSKLTYEGYLSGGRFPSLWVCSKVEEGPHQVKISFFNERGKKIASVENRKVFG
ncbi:hypothetical protein AKJ41_00740 [candidate division MSBL1 archaeon SCGC-AAA259O05]|uniref:Uncharacterized protein n=1 Tax=candidate division MSBL1 archaeon SCGC-AAA259O05 TaxID=1698271 RepID=A0A133V5D7_9EURY|nr:hypothetical protein AKJ41_00740 [candidate division MSBL1 archaeon SCGC-AAA259O05]